MKSSEFLIRHTEGLRWISFPPLDAYKFLLHGFIAKPQQPFQSASQEMLGKILPKIASSKKQLVNLSQTHQDNCVIINHGEYLKELYPGDAVLTKRDDVLICVQVADCLPIFLVNETNKVIGMVHAGWRSTLLGIIRRTLIRAKADFGCQPGDFMALLGPCIQACCYKISDDVAILFDRECIKPAKNGNLTLDLICANVKQLTDCGVKQDRIFDVGECTCCNADLFFSYRREGKGTGRMVAFMSFS
jgi:YfiH family protein